MAITKVVVEKRVITPGQCKVGDPQCEDVTGCGAGVPPACPPCPPADDFVTGHVLDVDDPTFDFMVPMGAVLSGGVLRGYAADNIGLGGAVFSLVAGCGFLTPPDGGPPGAYLSAGGLIKEGNFVLAVAFANFFPADCNFKRNYGLLRVVPGVTARRLTLTVS